MQVSVGINASNKKDFSDQLERASELLPKKVRLHIDVSDPKFSSIKSYFSAPDLKKYSPRFDFEAHLMVPDKKISGYFKKPLKKIFVHISAVKDWAALAKEAKKSKISLGVAIGVSEEKYKDRIPKSIKSIMVLAVTPGPSGQKFGKKSLKLVSFLRKKYPRATIAIDGGITPETARMSKRKGAKEAISTSFIWGSEDPLRAYKTLKHI